MVNFADFLQRLFASSAPSDGGGGGNGNDGEKQDGDENTGTTASYVNHDHEIGIWRLLSKTKDRSEIIFLSNNLTYFMYRQAYASLM